MNRRPTEDDGYRKARDCLWRVNGEWLRGGRRFVVLGPQPSPDRIRPTIAAGTLLRGMVVFDSDRKVCPPYVLRALIKEACGGA